MKDVLCVTTVQWGDVCGLKFVYLEGLKKRLNDRLIHLTVCHASWFVIPPFCMAPSTKWLHKPCLAPTLDKNSDMLPSNIHEVCQYFVVLLRMYILAHRWTGSKAYTSHQNLDYFIFGEFGSYFQRVNCNGGTYAFLSEISSTFKVHHGLQLNHGLPGIWPHIT
jgi:hypothetical protein